MAKALYMSHPYALLFRSQVLPPSSLLQPSKRHFVSYAAVFSNRTNFLWPSNNNKSKPQIDNHGHKFYNFGFELVGSRRFATRATHVNDAGSIDSSLIQSMEKKIKEELNAELVIVKDAYGDGRHVSIDVVSSAFEGHSDVDRQRMVYKAIWEELQSTVHAVDEMTTQTPAEVSPKSD